MQKQLEINTSGRGIYDITSSINSLVISANISAGLCHIFCQHTSCSLILCENYDDDVKVDIETYLSELVVDGDNRFLHIAEGKDDMSAHIRTMLTQSELTIPITDNHLALGPWQGINLYEHRYGSYHRNLIITLIG
ncbi:secondary thiamine-phosphate synthase enzyme YjbQ [Thiotrichales bacterium 19X7-9]|nr:secondary thiamine-phosphate synthase enzyme YjbQ [Thiotrichales bacterium 19X7-9]